MPAVSEDHEIEPEGPWHKSPTTVQIRCNVCMDLRYFADRHAEHLDQNSPGPHCKVCGLRIEFRCTVCDSQWQPMS